MKLLDLKSVPSEIPKSSLMSGINTTSLDDVPVTPTSGGKERSK
jgi:hypothetical protein